MPTELAPAKVNLTLHLTGLRDDGYHLLESLVVFAGVGDLLTVAAADDLSLTVTGPMAAGVPADGSNLVLKAAERLRQLRGVTCGAEILLEKHLPHGGGIGGGSADAASAIRALSRLWQVAPLTVAEALALGADIPVCLMAPRPMVMEGIGESLTPAPALPQGWLVLINPRVHLPTAEVFRLHDRLYDFSLPGLEPFSPEPLDMAEFSTWLHGQRNDLTKVASADNLAPVIGSILTALRQNPGLVACNMSGSGSTCWALFAARAEAEQTAARFAAQHPDWWVVACPMLGAEDQLIRDTT